MEHRDAPGPATHVAAALGPLAVLRFLAELGMLVALGRIGFHAGDTTWTSLAQMVGLPLVAALVWGRWVAPRAGHRLRDPARLAVEATLFAVAFLGLLGTEPRPGGIVAGLALWTAYLASVGVGRGL